MAKNAPIVPESGAHKDAVLKLASEIPAILNTTLAAHFAEANEDDMYGRSLEYLSNFGGMTFHSFLTAAAKKKSGRHSAHFAHDDLSRVQVKGVNWLTVLFPLYEHIAENGQAEICAEAHG